jgi:hypothetical protein
MATLQNEVDFERAPILASDGEANGVGPGRGGKSRAASARVSKVAERKTGVARFNRIAGLCQAHSRPEIAEREQSARRRDGACARLAGAKTGASHLPRYRNMARARQNALLEVLAANAGLQVLRRLLFRGASGTAGSDVDSDLESLDMRHEVG